MKTNTESRSISPARAKINLGALSHNLKRVKELAPESRVVSVIKANAYGHGILPAAEALIDSDCFAVARLDEAVYLRQHGIKKPIILLEGIFSADEYRQCIEQQLIPSIHCLEQLQWLKTAFKQDLAHSKLRYWLKVDTGMHRLGLSKNEITHLLESLNDPSFDLMPTGIMSHFSCADETDNSENSRQLSLFRSICQSDTHLNIEKSMANSAAILSLPDAHFDWVRPGIMLYGVSPFETATPMRTGLDEQLKPVMTLCSELIAIKRLKKGDCIGYGATWCCPEDMSIGVVAVGYGDGYPRHAPNGTPVLMHGVELPLVGRVSMDMITIDLRKLEPQSITASIGDKVILWGDGLPIERVSQKTGTIAYELLCQITQRVYFEYE